MSKAIYVHRSVAEVLAKLVDGWRPRLPSLPTVHSMTWGMLDIQNVVSVDLSQERIRLQCGPPFEPGNRSANGEPLRGVLDGGLSLNVERAFWSSSRGTDSWIEGVYWTLTDPSRDPTLWIAELAGSVPEFGSNLIVRRSLNDESGGHFLLRGAYTYFVVRCAERWFLVVETPDGRQPTRKELFPDFLALQFALGRVLSIDRLLGVDAAGQVIGVVGGRFGRHVGRNSQFEAPVPMWVHDDAWAPTLFDRVSRTYRERPELRLHIPLSAFVDVLADYLVEARYLRLHVALEALAYWLMKAKQQEDAEVVDKPGWRAWVRTHEMEIRRLAKPGFEDLLFNNVKGAHRHPSGKLVALAFHEFGLDLTKEMTDELGNGRGGIVHRAVMFDESQPEVDAYLNRIAVVRTMLVALLSKIVGYRGPIQGWQRTPGHPFEPAPSSWWSPDTQAETEAQYVAVVDESQSARGVPE